MRQPWSKTDVIQMTRGQWLKEKPLGDSLVLSGTVQESAGQHNPHPRPTWHGHQQLGEWMVRTPLFFRN